MLVHDQLSGRIHEVPDQLMGYGLGEVVYDGLGNPVGAWWNPADWVKGAADIVGGAVKTAGNLVGNVVGAPISAAGQLVSSLLPGTSSPAPPPPASFPYLYPAGNPPYFSPAGMPPFPMQQPYGGMPPPWPAGWMRPSLPYTGLGPQRLYMRCAVWPGPQGLVPGYAANMPPGSQPVVPGIPGTPAFPAQPGPFRSGHRRRHRR